MKLNRPVSRHLCRWLTSLLGLIAPLTLLAGILYIYFLLLFPESRGSTLVSLNSDPYALISHEVEAVEINVGRPESIDLELRPNRECQGSGVRPLVLTYSAGFTRLNVFNAEVVQAQATEEGGLETATISFVDCSKTVSIHLFGSVSMRSAGDVLMDISIRHPIRAGNRVVAEMRGVGDLELVEVSDLVSLPPTSVKGSQSVVEFEMSEDVDALSSTVARAVDPSINSFFILSGGIDIRARFYDPIGDRLHEFQVFVLGVLVGVASSWFTSSLVTALSSIFGRKPNP